MLQTINAVHHFSVMNPTLYFGTLLILSLIVIWGWYRLGTMIALATVSPAPTSAPVCPRWILYRRSTAIVLQVANLLFLGQIVKQENGIASTIALKVTWQVGVLRNGVLSLIKSYRVSCEDTQVVAKPPTRRGGPRDTSARLARQQAAH